MNDNRYSTSYSFDVKQKKKSIVVGLAIFVTRIVSSPKKQINLSISYFGKTYLPIVESIPLSARVLCQHNLTKYVISTLSPDQAKIKRRHKLTFFSITRPCFVRSNRTVSYAYRSLETDLSRTRTSRSIRGIRNVAYIIAG